MFSAATDVEPVFAEHFPEKKQSSTSFYKPGTQEDFLTENIIGALKMTDKETKKKRHKNVSSFESKNLKNHSLDSATHNDFNAEKDTAIKANADTRSKIPLPKQHTKGEWQNNLEKNINTETTAEQEESETTAEQSEFNGIPKADFFSVYENKQNSFVQEENISLDANKEKQRLRKTSLDKFSDFNKAHQVRCFCFLK